MKFTCPTCARVFQPENINVQTDLALCPACGNAARLSELADTDFDRDALASPPPGAWFRETMNDVVIGATTRSPLAFFLVPFMCVWSGASLGGIYGSQIVSGKFNPFLSLFGLPFVAGSVLFWSLALMAIWGKVEVRLRDRRGEIFTGIGSIGWKRPVDLAEVTRISEERFARRRSQAESGRILLEGKTRLRFGSTLTEPRRLFVINALRAVQARR